VELVFPVTVRVVLVSVTRGKRSAYARIVIFDRIQRSKNIVRNKDRGKATVAINGSLSRFIIDRYLNGSRLDGSRARLTVNVSAQHNG